MKRHVFVFLPWIFAALLAVFVIALTVNHILQTPFREYRERQQMKAQKLLAKEELEKAVWTSGGVLWAAKVGAGAARLWPVWGVLLAGMALVFARFRFAAQVPFQAGEISTTIPASKAVSLTREALRAHEAAEQAKLAMLQEDVTHKRLADNVGAIRALKSLVPKETPELRAIDIEQPALPAFRGNVHLSQLLLDSDYEAGLIPYGRALDTKNLVQVDFDTRKTVLKIGLQGTGKTTSTKAELFAALTLRYEQGQAVRLYLIDAHFGFQESLATDLRDYLPLFDACVLGKDCLTGGALDLLTRMISEAEAFQTSGKIQPETTDLLWIDEYSELIDTADDGKDIEKAVKRLVNLRKANKFLSLNVYDGSKGNNSNKGLHPAKMACSVMCYRTNETQAGQVLGWQNKDIIRQVPGLEVGQAVLSIPGADMAIVQTALVNDADFYRFNQYLPIQAAKMTPEQEIAPDVDVDTQVTAARVKEWRESHDVSQKRFAEICKISLSKLKRFESENQKEVDWEEAEINRMLDAISARENRKVVNLNQWRNA